jgi:hypothetical protein
MNGGTMKKKDRTPGSAKFRRGIQPLTELNRSITALAAHLCTYVNVLRQCSEQSRPAPHA